MSNLLLDSALPGGKIQAMPLVNSEIADFREGRTVLGGVPWMLPGNAVEIANFLEATKGEVLNRRDAKDREILKQLLINSLTNNFAAGELAAYRQFEIIRDILATPFALGAFQAVPLADDELPLIVRPQTQQHFNVRYTGQDGGLRSSQWTTTRSVSSMEMRTIATDKVAYPLHDIQLGNIQESDKVNAAVRFDLEMKLDTEAKAAIDDLQIDSGLRDLLTLHPLLIAANFPDKNHLDLSDTDEFGDAHVLTLARLKAILAHISSLSVQELGPEGSLSIRSMLISPQNVRDQWDYVNLVSCIEDGPTPIDPKLTVPTGVREQIFSTGTMNSAWGYKWATVPNARMDIGRLYVFMNKPIGWYFTKPKMDRLLKWDSPDLQLANENYVAMTKVIQFATVEEWAHRIVIVDF